MRAEDKDLIGCTIGNESQVKALLPKHGNRKKSISFVILPKSNYHLEWRDTPRLGQGWINCCILGPETIGVGRE